MDQPKKKIRINKWHPKYKSDLINAATYFGEIMSHHNYAIIKAFKVN